MPEYTITIDDIKGYLATFGPNDTVGLCRDSTSCLVSRALNWKYGTKFEASHDSFATWHSTENIPTTPDIRQVVIDFDKIGPYGAEITRKQVEESIEQLRG